MIKKILKWFWFISEKPAVKKKKDKVDLLMDSYLMALPNIGNAVLYDLDMQPVKLENSHDWDFFVSILGTIEPILIKKKELINRVVVLKSKCTRPQIKMLTWLSINTLKRFKKWGSVNARTLIKIVLFVDPVNI